MTSMISKFDLLIINENILLIQRKNQILFIRNIIRGSKKLNTLTGSFTTSLIDQLNNN